MPEQRSIILCTALLLAALLMATIPFLGWSEDSVRLLVRISARVSMVLFSLAFSASALQGLFPSRAFAYLLRNRRYIGLSFALSHSLHLAGLLVLGLHFPSPFLEELDSLTLAGGGLAYGFLYAMALTSSDAAVRWLGPARWHRLHQVGGWYIWAIFAQSYFPLALEGAGAIPMAALSLASLMLRLARWRSIRRGKG